MARTEIGSEQVRNQSIRLEDLHPEVLTGITGSQGPQGQVGPQGTQGVQGSQGATGAQGSQGSYTLGSDPHFGDTYNYTHFRTNGTMEAIGTATVWDDIFPLAIYVPTGSVAPNITAILGTRTIKAQEFPNEINSSVEEYNPTYQIPHKWKLDSTIIPHIHLAVPANATGNTYTIKFKMVYTWDNIDPDGSNNLVPDTEHTLYGTYTVGANKGANPNAILSFGNVVGTGKSISSIFACRIVREINANGDTYSGSVWLKSADIHAEFDTTGSDEEFIKFVAA